MEACVQPGFERLDPDGRVAGIALSLLSEKGRLRCEAARLQCLPLRRGDTLCGLCFALRGPREVLLTAVWDAETGMLWCYDSRGERFTQVSTGVEEAAEDFV